MIKDYTSTYNKNLNTLFDLFKRKMEAILATFWFEKKKKDVQVQKGPTKEIISNTPRGFPFR